MAAHLTMLSTRIPRANAFTNERLSLNSSMTTCRNLATTDCSWLSRHQQQHYCYRVATTTAVVSSSAEGFETSYEAEAEAEEKFEWYAQWYPVMPVCDLDKRKPHGKRVIGLDVVAWWDKTECEWKVFNDMCPHRLAPLSEGRIDQWGRLQCVYHGWCFNASGQCQLIPQAPPDGPPVHKSKKACVAVYPSTVQNGILWFWPNSDAEFKDILHKKKPPLLPELDDPSYSSPISIRFSTRTSYP